MKPRGLTTIIISTLMMLTLQQRLLPGSTEEKWGHVYTSQGGPMSDDWVTIRRMGCSAGCSDRTRGVAPRAEANRPTISITINKGECYVIGNLKADVAPYVKVVNNPNSLVVHTEVPGQIVVVGADSGSWKFDVTLNSGEKATYMLKIKALAPPQGSLVPVSAPTAIP